MAIEQGSGVSTPLSSTSTLSAPGSPVVLPKLANDLERGYLKDPQVSASTTIEFISSRVISSSSVFVYDLAEQAGFGTLTKSWANADRDIASVVSLQTRAGAGLSLVGRLAQGSSRETAKGAILTAYTTPSGLAAMVQSLSYVPAATPSSRLVIQVPTVTPVGESFTLSPTVAPFMPTLGLLSENFAVISSATPQEAVDIASLTYKLVDTHVVHFFDHHGSARERGHVFKTPAMFFDEPLTLKEGLDKAGYNFFDFYGDKSARTVLVLFNGPVALAVRALLRDVPGVGVLVVRVLRPWDEEALRQVLPETAKNVHVFDDVPSESTQGTLYTDVFGALLVPSMPSPIVKSHRVTPSRTQEFITTPSSLLDYVSAFVPDVKTRTIVPQKDVKKVIIFDTPESPKAQIPRNIEKIFRVQNVAYQSLTDYDAFSKPGGVTADRIVLSAEPDAAAYVPVSVALPLTPSSPGEADLVAVLDQSLLKSHDIVALTKPGGILLVDSTWETTELLTNLPREVVELIRERKISLCPIDSVNSVRQTWSLTPKHLLPDLVNLHIQLSFLRLYLAGLDQRLVIKLAEVVYGHAAHDIPMSKFATEVYHAAIQVDLPDPQEVFGADSEKSATLKPFEFNAIAVETAEGDTVVNGARLGSWHDAAKHILFPSAFTPNGAPPADTGYVRDPALRPEISDNTYLITCTVNRRLTPLDYDRNVFHLEFDTRGTGLKYEIGEALGVHGWNDTDEVLDFCSWYGVDPNKVVTIPVPGQEGRMHSRTVFQALQQQIDLFGKPGKTFYTELAEHATAKPDKYALRFIGAPEGSSMFKKLSEIDTVTFADILKRYSSARPRIEVLCELIGDIKPRHYSIASAQSVVGDRVDLLVVSVNWVTPSGKW